MGMPLPGCWRGGGWKNLGLELSMRLSEEETESSMAATPGMSEDEDEARMTVISWSELLSAAPPLRRREREMVSMCRLSWERSSGPDPFPEAPLSPIDPPCPCPSSSSWRAWCRASSCCRRRSLRRLHA